MNGATCVDGACILPACVVEYSCTCADGYAGEHCELDINECSSYPCTWGGTCVDAIHRYSCVCAAGYSGFNCEVDIDECMSSPCLNGASCLHSMTGRPVSSPPSLCIHSSK